jgi:hypothetical protein
MCVQNFVSLSLFLVMQVKCKHFYGLDGTCECAPAKCVAESTKKFVKIEFEPTHPRQNAIYIYKTENVSCRKHFNGIANTGVGGFKFDFNKLPCQFYSTCLHIHNRETSGYLLLAGDDDNPCSLNTVRLRLKNESKTGRKTIVFAHNFFP